MIRDAIRITEDLPAARRTDQTTAIINPRRGLSNPSGMGRFVPAWVWVALLATGMAGCQSKPDKVTQWLGLNVQLVRPTAESVNGAASRGPDRERTFGFLDELGARLVRDAVMDWSVVQPAAGASYDFTLIDDIVTRAQVNEVDILAVCERFPAWASGGRVPAREHAPAFSAFVREFVERYDGDGKKDLPKLRVPITAYEFIRQPEDIAPAEYAYWLKVFYTSVKEAHPDAIVACGGLKSPGLKMFDAPGGDYHLYLEKLLAQPELQGDDYPYFDVVSFHNFPMAYPGRREFDEALTYLRTAMSRHRLSLPIWLTAFGFDSGAREEATQAENLVKWSVRA
mgnify:FL=1